MSGYELTTSQAETGVVVAKAIADITCPRCKAEPGEPCIWRTQHSDQVHAPRLNKVLIAGGGAA
jgi:hypothetical protein